MSSGISGEGCGGWDNVISLALVSPTVYEAGKAAKAGFPPSVSGVPGPFSIPSVPLGGTPSSGMLMDKPHPPPLAPSDSTGGSHSGNCPAPALPRPRRVPC